MQHEIQEIFHAFQKGRYARRTALQRVKKASEKQFYSSNSESLFSHHDRIKCMCINLLMQIFRADEDAWDEI